MVNLEDVAGRRTGNKQLCWVRWRLHSFRLCVSFFDHKVATKWTSAFDTKMIRLAYDFTRDRHQAN